MAANLPGQQTNEWRGHEPACLVGCRSPGRGGLLFGAGSDAESERDAVTDPYCCGNTSTHGNADRHTVSRGDDFGSTLYGGNGHRLG
jgi:hypothetical protein